MKKCLFVLLFVSYAQAQESQSLSTSSASNRNANKMGITSGFGNPFPSILGINLNYNLTDFARAKLGYGSVSVSSGDSEASVKTLGTGVDFLVPGWSLSPTAGFHVSKVDVSSSGGTELSIQGIEKTTNLVYAQLGLDWQAQGGFNFGVGAIAGLSGGSVSGSYMSLGWFF